MAAMLACLRGWIRNLQYAYAYFFSYGTWTHKHFEKMGVPGPKPFPLLGNINILLREGFFCDKWLTKKFGRVFGYALSARCI